jgi:acetate---CoA ligase (ADP-forming) subunit beta
VLVNEYESKKQLAAAGVKVVATELAKSKEEAVSISSRLGYPVVLKIVSSDIVHKSDAGGVKLGLKNASEVGEAYQAIMGSVKAKFPQAKVDGVSVQAMARPGVEVIVGMYKDAQFGPVLMFGLGGIWVEILKDVSFKITPLTRQDAADMIREIKAFPLLKGYRGSEPVSLEALEEFILKVASFVEANPRIKELDLNPVFAYKDGAIAVDARIIVED